MIQKKIVQKIVQWSTNPLVQSIFYPMPYHHGVTLYYDYMNNQGLLLRHCIKRRPAETNITFWL